MRIALTAAITLLAATSSLAQRPIIDMHIHALPANFQGEPGATHPRTGEKAPLTESGILDGSLAAMERNNIVKAIVSGPMDIVENWRQAAPEIVLASPKFPVFGPWPDVDKLREDHAQGVLQAIGEITGEYAGLPADSPALAPYFALAEELDLPVAIHLGQGPPEAILMQCCPNFSLEAGRPLHLEPVLQRHRNLRIYVAHMARPFVDEMLAIMTIYPRVYVDISGAITGSPDAFREYILEFLRSGMGNRLMFGSDQMIWPGTIDSAVAAVLSASFLSEGQKRDILYNNAARFLRLSDDEIARHHRR